MFASIRFKLDQCIGSILIELMLVMVIGLLLISFLLETYTTSKQSYALQSALSQLQDNAKTAIDILKSDIHKAGYIGCPYLSHDFVTLLSKSIESLDISVRPKILEVAGPLLR